MSIKRIGGQFLNAAMMILVPDASSRLRRMLPSAKKTPGGRLGNMRPPFDTSLSSAPHITMAGHGRPEHGVSSPADNPSLPRF
jgi:hypothetical protein